MSKGICEHEIFGLTKTFIYNNKRVIEMKYEPQIFESWYSKYMLFKIKIKEENKIRFYLLPELVGEGEVKKKSSIFGQKQFRGITRILYEYYGVTLKEELESRSKIQQKYEYGELWFILYALVCGSLQMLNIKNKCNLGQVSLSLDNILMNQFGKIKIIGEASIPDYRKNIHRRDSYNTSLRQSQGEMTEQENIGESIGLIMASLILLKDIEVFYDKSKKKFKNEEFLKFWCKIGTEMGLLWNFISQLIGARINLSQVFIMLRPYEKEITSLSGFQIQKQVCREALLQQYLEKQ